jgi:CRP-like cAMP-binding protein
MGPRDVCSAQTEGAQFLANPFESRTHPLIRHLESITVLSDDDKHVLVNLPMQVLDLKADQDIVREGDRPTRCCVILEGFACTFKHTGRGKRQIMNFHIPGDIPDLQSLHLTFLDSSLGTITPCKAGFVQHEHLLHACEQHHRISTAFWRASLVDAAIFREWVMNIGQREAYARLAHLLCETMTRMKAVGLCEDDSCELPMTQTELGDAMGLSTVHINRTLQELRRDKLITLKGGKLRVLDWEGLTKAGDFNPNYLHLRDRGI